MEMPQSFTAQLNARIRRLPGLTGESLLREGTEILVLVLEEMEKLEAIELNVRAALGLQTLPE